MNSRIVPLRGLLHLLVPLCLLACSLVAAAQPVTITDDRGRTVKLAKPPTRIVSLLPSLTETVCALQACNRLVGVDRYSTWPADKLARLPRVGGGLDPQIESIVALRPDLVLVSEASRATDRLSALGIPVVALQTRNHAEVRRTLDKVAIVLGLPQAQATAQWQRIQDGIARAAQTVPAAARGATVFVEVSRGPFAAGESSFIGETLTHLGLKNVVPAALGPFPKLNPEFVLRANPDLLMSSSRAQRGWLTNPGWSQLKAVRSNRICAFNVAESDLLIHPGPRMDEAAALMARCVAQRLPKGAGR